MDEPSFEMGEPAGGTAYDETESLICRFPIPWVPPDIIQALGPF